MARINKPMKSLLAELMNKVFEFSSQLHPDNTWREQKRIERRIHRHLETIAEYLAVIHDEGLNDIEEDKDVSSKASE